MCGRFTLTLTKEEINEIVKITELIDWKSRYNIAPMEAVPAIINDGQRQLKLFQWGLVPYWAKDKSIGNKLINARMETIETKPSFKHSFVSKRCLILADGFYEWKKEGTTKRPYLFTLTDRKLFSFAGIWDAWKNPEGKVLQSCTIITTAANELMKPIHERMPVILEKESEEAWLDSSIKDPLKLKSLLAPYPTMKMKYYEVSTKVNSSKIDNIECIQPLEKGSLF